MVVDVVVEGTEPPSRDLRVGSDGASCERRGLGLCSWSSAETEGVAENVKMRCRSSTENLREDRLVDRLGDIGLSVDAGSTVTPSSSTPDEAAAFRIEGREEDCVLLVGFDMGSDVASVKSTFE